MIRANVTAVLAGLASGAALLAAAAALSTQNEGKSGHCCVATIDVNVVFNEYQRQKDLTEELRQWQEKSRLESEARRQKIDAAQAALDALSPGDPVAPARWRELVQMQIDFKNWSEYTQAEMQREIGLWTAKVYQEIVTATEELARARGLDVVLFRDEFRPAGNPEQVREQILRRSLIYASAATDVSQPVLEKLNAAYRAQPRVKMMGGP